MGTRLQRRRGTTAQHSSFTGAVGEFTYDTDLKTIRAHDGVTAGGNRLAKFSEVSASAARFVRVRAVAASNVALATGLEDGDTVDGVTLATGDQVLLAGQSAPAENGVYDVVASGAAARSSSFASYDDLPGVHFAVMEGTVYADTLWRCTSDLGGTIDSTALAIESLLANVNRDLLPKTDSAFDLGSSSRAWAEAYADKALADTVQALSGGENTAMTYVVHGSLKAWATLDGTGTIAVADSLNISGVVDEGVGEYTFTIANDFADVNYSAVGTTGGSNGSTVNTPKESISKAAGSLRVGVFNAGATGFSDVDPLHMHFVGDLA